MGVGIRMRLLLGLERLDVDDVDPGGFWSRNECYSAAFMFGKRNDMRRFHGWHVCFHAYQRLHLCGVLMVWVWKSSC